MSAPGVVARTGSGLAPLCRMRLPRTELPSGLTSRRGSSGPNGLCTMPTPTESLPTTELAVTTTWSPPTFKMPVPVGSRPTSSPLSAGTGFGMLLWSTTLASIVVSSFSGIGSPGSRDTSTPTVLPISLLPRTTECAAHRVAVRADRNLPGSHLDAVLVPGRLDDRRTAAPDRERALVDDDAAFVRARRHHDRVARRGRIDRRLAGTGHYDDPRVRGRRIRCGGQREAGHRQGKRCC